MPKIMSPYRMSMINICTLNVNRRAMKITTSKKKNKITIRFNAKLQTKKKQFNLNRKTKIGIWCFVYCDIHPFDYHISCIQTLCVDLIDYLLYLSVFDFVSLNILTPHNLN